MRFTRKSLADIYHETRAYIERNGWWKGALRGPNRKQVCISGGLIHSQGWQHSAVADNVSARHSADFTTARETLLKVVNTPAFDHGRTWNDIESWNDDERTSKQQVLDVLAKAEKIQRAGFDPDAP